MYRLLLYGLLVLLFVSAILAGEGGLPFSVGQLAGSTLVLVATCYVANRLFAYIYAVPVNAESALISALIFACILPPPQKTGDYLGLIVAGVVAMASKYIVAWGHKHIFNPVAFGAVAIGVFNILQPTWWIGSARLWPFTLLLTLLIVRKIKRFDLLLSFK